jgi:predicted HTH domain antitoxin
MTSVLGTRVPNQIMKEINYVAKEEHTDKSTVVRELLLRAVKRKLLDLALAKYAKQTISLGRAAELAKVPLSDFMKAAVEQKIPVNYSLDSLEKDYKAALQ